MGKRQYKLNKKYYKYMDRDLREAYECLIGLKMLEFEKRERELEELEREADEELRRAREAVRRAVEEQKQREDTAEDERDCIDAATQGELEELGIEIVERTTSDS